MLIFKACIIAAAIGSGVAGALNLVDLIRKCIPTASTRENDDHDAVANEPDARNEIVLADSQQENSTASSNSSSTIAPNNVSAGVGNAGGFSFLIQLQQSRQLLRIASTEPAAFLVSRMSIRCTNTLIAGSAMAALRTSYTYLPYHGKVRRANVGDYDVTAAVQQNQRLAPTCTSLTLFISTDSLFRRAAAATAAVGAAIMCNDVASDESPSQVSIPSLRTPAPDLGARFDGRHDDKPHVLEKRSALLARRKARRRVNTYPPSRSRGRRPLSPLRSSSPSPSPSRSPSPRRSCAVVLTSTVAPSSASAPAADAAHASSSSSSSSSSAAAAAAGAVSNSAASPSPPCSIRISSSKSEAELSRGPAKAAFAAEHISLEGYSTDGAMIPPLRPASTTSSPTFDADTRSLESSSIVSRKSYDSASSSNADDTSLEESPTFVVSDVARRGPLVGLLPRPRTATRARSTEKIAVGTCRWRRPDVRMLVRAIELQVEGQGGNEPGSSFAGSDSCSTVVSLPTEGAQDRDVREVDIETGNIADIVQKIKPGQLRRRHVFNTVRQISGLGLGDVVTRVRMAKIGLGGYGGGQDSARIVDGEGVLGEGSFSTVAKVSHGVMPGPFALKKPGKGAPLEAKICILVEMIVFARLAKTPHEHVLRAIAMDDRSGAVCKSILLPMLEGDFEGILQGGKWTAAIRLRCLTQVVSGVRHLHGMGLVHNDLKPANILVDRDGKAKICDFGFARVVGEQRPKCMGTPAYMPLEVIGRAVAAHTSQDVFSMAVMTMRVCLKPEKAVANPFISPEFYTTRETEIKKALDARSSGGGDRFITRDTQLFEISMMMRTKAAYDTFTKLMAVDNLDPGLGSDEDMEMVSFCLPPFMHLDPISRPDMACFMKVVTNLVKAADLAKGRGGSKSVWRRWN